MNASNYSPAMQKANFEEDYEFIEIGRITKRVAHLVGDSATLVRFPVGASVTEDAVKTGYLGGADMCPQPHIGYILSGTLGVRQRDGEEMSFSAGDVMMLPPDHEAWTVGDEDCVFVEFARGGDDYYGASH